MEYTELRKKGVYLGRAGEDGKRTVWLDVTAWNEQAGGGSGVLLYTSPKGQVWPLGTKTETDETTGTVKLSAPITLAETAAAGIGHIEAQWMSGGEKVKSQTFNTLVLESAYTGETVPDKAPHWVQELIEELNAAGMLLEELGEVASEAHAAYDEIRETGALIDQALATAQDTVDQAQEYAEAAEDHAANANAYKTAAAASATAAATSAEQAMDATPDGYATFVGSMAPAYSASASYAVGNLVLKDGQLYKCMTAIDGGETWTAAHWAAVTAGGEIGTLNRESAELMKEVFSASYNLVDCNDASKWRAQAGKDVTITVPAADTIRVQSNVSQTYAAAEYDIDVSDIDYLWISMGSVVEDGGDARSRLFGNAGGTLTDIGGITRAGKKFDVTSYNLVTIRLGASAATASDGSVEYVKVLAAASEEELPYVPYSNDSKIDELDGRVSDLEAASASITGLNEDAAKALQNLKMRNNRADRTNPAPSVLTLIHFSDIHADATSLRRIVKFRDTYTGYIDDAICTGDMVLSRYNNNCMDFWNGVNGAESILMTIGNHDALPEGHSFAPGQYIDQSDAYDMYIKDYAEGWGAEYTEDHTYYYKDYDAAKIRLICLDMMLEGADRAAQLAWLTNTLDDARANELSVVIAQHFAPKDNDILRCNFSALDNMGPSVTTGWCPETSYLAAVDGFKQAGGDFVCWLGGHTHCDYIVYPTGDYADQLFITVTCAKRDQAYSDQARVNGTKSQDAFNLIAFDTYYKLIKIVRVGADSDYSLRGRHALTIDYTNKTIVASN